MICNVEPRRSPSTRPLAVAALPAFALLASLLAPAPAGAEIPLEPEVAIDHEPGLYLDCPQIAGRRDGRFAIAWTRHDLADFHERFLVFTSDAANQVTTLDEPAGDDRVRAEAFTTIPGGYRALWRHQAPDALVYVAGDVGLDGGAHPPVTLGAAGTLRLSPRPRGGYVAQWNGNRGLFVQLRDEAGGPTGLPVRLRVANVGGSQVLHQSDASFIVVYSQQVTRNGQLRHQGLRGQRFDATGRPVGRSFRLLPGQAPGRSPLAMLALGFDGTIAVLSAVAGDPAAAGAGQVTLQTFTSSGVPLSAGIAITTAAQAPTEESYPEGLTVDPEGRVLAIWGQVVDVYAPVARARVFSRTGAPLGPPFDPRSPDSAPHTAITCAAADWAGDAWVISWIGSTTPIDDDSTMQVYMRRFRRQ